MVDFETSMRAEIDRKWTKKETGKYGTQYYVDKILHGLGAVYRRSNSGFIKGARIGAAGWPDFDVIVNGYYIGIECKGLTKSGKLTPFTDNQLDQLPKIIDIGGACVAVVVNPSETFDVIDGDCDQTSKRTIAELLHQAAKKRIRSAAQEAKRALAQKT